MSADTQQQSNNLLHKQSMDSPQQEPSPVGGSGDVVTLRVQDVPTAREGDLTQNISGGSVEDLKPSLRSKEQSLKVRLLHIAGDNQQSQAHIQV